MESRDDPATRRGEDRFTCRPRVGKAHEPRARFPAGRRHPSMRILVVEDKTKLASRVAHALREPA